MTFRSERAEQLVERRPGQTARTQSRQNRQQVRGRYPAVFAEIDGSQGDVFRSCDAVWIGKLLLS
jgi:hypothetical protein